MGQPLLLSVDVICASSPKRKKKKKMEEGMEEREREREATKERRLISCMPSLS